MSGFEGMSNFDLIRLLGGVVVAFDVLRRWFEVVATLMGFILRILAESLRIEFGESPPAGERLRETRA